MSQTKILIIGRRLLIYILPLCAVFYVSFGCWRVPKQLWICEGSYALCTSAHCIPQPGYPSKSICFCEVVEQGQSVSNIPCIARKPRIDKQGVTTLLSAFSYKHSIEGTKLMKCPGKTPWSRCLNKRCTVDPKNPKGAICFCDVIDSDEDWLTFGGGCDPTTCSKGYWSGSSIASFDKMNIFMKKKLKLEELPIRWCVIQ